MLLPQFLLVDDSYADVQAFVTMVKRIGLVNAVRPVSTLAEARDLLASAEPEWLPVVVFSGGEVRDGDGQLRDHATDRLAFEYRVISRSEGYQASRPSIPGDVFVIEQLIRSSGGTTRRELAFSVTLGACVQRKVWDEYGQVTEESLTLWRKP